MMALEKVNLKDLINFILIFKRKDDLLQVQMSKSIGIDLYVVKIGLKTIRTIGGR